MRPQLQQIASCRISVRDFSSTDTTGTEACNDRVNEPQCKIQAHSQKVTRSVGLCVCVCLESLVYASPAGKIRRESSVSSCFLDLNSCVKSSEPGQVWLHMLWCLMNWCWSEHLQLHHSHPKPDVHILEYSTIQHTFFYLTRHCWFVCVRVGINVCSCNLSFFRLGSFQLSALLFSSLKLNSYLHGWLAGDVL